MAEDREYKRLLNENRKHRGEWLTEEDALEYIKRAENLANLGRQDSGLRRELRREFQERFGLLEIEAINILNGFYVAFYVDKYYRIKNLIKLSKDDKKDDFIEGED